jgi:hypothetical protein
MFRLARQARLADPRFTKQNDTAAVAVTRRLEKGADRLQLVIAPDDPRAEHLAHMSAGIVGYAPRNV